jgi:hypothetical protein
MITFTYPDSMTSLPLATLIEHREDRKPYHGQVFTLDEIERVVAEYGMPGTAIGRISLRHIYRGSNLGRKSASNVLPIEAQQMSMDHNHMSLSTTPLEAN